MGGLMSSIVVSGDTSGAITIAAPAVAGTNTLTLPANTGTVITTASTFAGTGPAFIASSTAGQSLTGGTWTKIQFNIELYDSNSCYDNTTNYRFTPTVAGYYQVNSIAETNSTSYGAISIYKNGSMYREAYINNPTSGTTSTIACLVYLNGSTDYIESWVRVNNSSSLYANQQVDYEFSAFLARAA
jgi:hypothetical protein